jgi:hypothetical protein
MSSVTPSPCNAQPVGFPHAQRCSQPRLPGRCCASGGLGRSPATGRPFPAPAAGGQAGSLDGLAGPGVCRTLRGWRSPASFPIFSLGEGVALQRGRGALRIWADVSKGELVGRRCRRGAGGCGRPPGRGPGVAGVPDADRPDRRPRAGGRLRDPDRRPAVSDARRAALAGRQRAVLAFRCPGAGTGAQRVACRPAGPCRRQPDCGASAAGHGNPCADQRASGQGPGRERAGAVAGRDGPARDLRASGEDFRAGCPVGTCSGRWRRKVGRDVNRQRLAGRAGGHARGRHESDRRQRAAGDRARGLVFSRRFRGPFDSRRDAGRGCAVAGQGRQHRGAAAECPVCQCRCAGRAFGQLAHQRSGRCGALSWCD